MNTIEQYINGLFGKLPASIDLLRLKDSVITKAKMQYSELIAQGISEHEAVGTVLHTLGSIDDILRAHDVSIPDVPPAAPYTQAPNYDDAEPLEDAVEDYLDAQYHIARMNALGVGLCICCPVAPLLLESIPFVGWWLGGSLGAVGFFACIALAVMLFIYSGNMKKSWRNFPYSIRLTEGMRMELRRREDDYAAQRASHIALGVGLCVFSPAAPAILNSFGAALMFLMIGFGVGLMILSDVRGKACRKLMKAAGY